jgi:hypothetical protein
MVEMVCLRNSLQLIVLSLQYNVQFFKLFSKDDHCYFFRDWRIKSPLMLSHWIQVRPYSHLLFILRHPLKCILEAFDSGAVAMKHLLQIQYNIHVKSANTDATLQSLLSLISHEVKLKKKLVTLNW